jgi:hypothetical protein
VDSPALQQFLTTELTYGLQVGIEAAALETINATSGIMAQAYNTSPLATLRKSLTVLETQGYEAGFMLLKPRRLGGCRTGVGVCVGGRIPRIAV